MIRGTRPLKWTPVETCGWTRRAYGRTIKYETEGGTLRCALPSSQAPGQLYLQLAVSGRMLVQMFCNDVQIFEDLVAHTEIDTFIDLRPDPLADRIDIELHLIPATFGEARIAQDVQWVQGRPISALLPERRSVVCNE